MKNPIPLSERLWSKIEVGKAEQCWHWRAATAGKGYGVIRADGPARNMLLAHRVVYELVCGEIGDKHVLHRCDNPICCNPSHLFLGTNDDNIADKVAKNRQLRGSQVGNSKLTETEVRWIKHWMRRGHSFREIARRFGVHFSSITEIKYGRIWGWLN